MAQSETKLTTPFGGGHFSAALIERQFWLDEQRKKAEDGGNDSTAVNKWQLLRALTEARVYFLVSDRTITVLEALLSFHQSAELDGREDIIVFPSNAELSRRTRGMAPATLRRHLSALVKGGFIIRKDSPNGKRYCRRGTEGSIQDAYGFNLAPFALMAAEIYDQAEQEITHQKEIKKSRAQVTNLLRDCRRLIELAFEEGCAHHALERWKEFEGRLDSLSGRLRRTEPLEALQAKFAQLAVLLAEIEELWLYELDHQNKEMSANDVTNERHIHNSNTDTHFDKSIENLKSRAEDAEEDGELENATERRGDYQISLNKLRLCCPNFTDYARDGLDSWADARRAAELVRPMLGISQDAWVKAQQLMGEGIAIAVLAYITQRFDEIKSPGGYLRALTARAELGKLSIKAMLDSLE